MRCEGDAVRSGTDAVRCEGDARSDLQGHLSLFWEVGPVLSKISYK